MTYREWTNDSFICIYISGDRATSRKPRLIRYTQIPSIVLAVAVTKPSLLEYLDHIIALLTLWEELNSLENIVVHMGCMMGRTHSSKFNEADLRSVSIGQREAIKITRRQQPWA